MENRHKNLMVSVSGIRGIVGESLEPDIIRKFSSCFGTFIGCGRVVVGRDSRVTGDMVQSAVHAGLLSAGCDVVDVGICPTPTIMLAVETLRATGGIAVTASHNSVEWNALKLIGSRGMFFTESESREFISRFNKGAEKFATWENVGKIYKDNNAPANHIKKIIESEFMNVDLIRKKKFRVALDCVNGAGGAVTPELLKRLGCDLIGLDLETTGLFKRNPEPLPEHLTELEKLVKRTGADIGFAHDPDADRLSIVSNQGVAIGEEYTLALAVALVLTKKKGPVVTNLSTSMMVDRIARNYGVNVLRTKVGEIHVAEKMLEIHAVIGGEGNGGLILPDIHYTRDAPAAVAMILQFMAETGKSIKELVESLPKFYIYKKKLMSNKGILDEKYLNEFKDSKINREDGFRIQGEDFFIHIRKSNTEPIIRIIAESINPEKSLELVNQVIERLK